MKPIGSAIFMALFVVCNSFRKCKSGSFQNDSIMSKIRIAEVCVIASAREYQSDKNCKSREISATQCATYKLTKGKMSKCKKLYNQNQSHLTIQHLSSQRNHKCEARAKKIIEKRAKREMCENCALSSA